MAVKVIEVHLPEYDINKKPNYIRLGKKVDAILEKSFSDGKYILRAISTNEHKGISLNKLANIVLRTGTDKYDLNRKGVCHDEFCGYDYDIQAGTFEIKNGKLIVEGNVYPTIFGDIVYHFYERTPLDRGYPVRIDLLLIYNPTKLEKARKVNLKAPPVRRKLINFLYKFKNPKNKKDALLGIIKVVK